MKKIIAFSGKGGVGKTTSLVLFLKYILETKNKLDILVIDSDPDANIADVIGEEVKFCDTIGGKMKDLKDKIRLSERILLSEKIVKEMVIQLIKQGEIRAKLKGETLVYIPEDKTIEILEDIKDNTEIIRTYSEKIEIILDKQDDLEDYLRSHLATDFEKIKEAWEDYKEGYITKKGLIKEAIKVLGKKFIKIVIKS